MEYADVRRYVPGDQLRTVNWPVSARRGSLHVTERLTDRAADVVVLVDNYPQPPGPATEKHTSPTGLSSEPPPGPAMPVMPTPTSASRRVRAPSASASAT